MLKRSDFRGKMRKIPKSSMDSGEGLLRTNYGPEDSTQSEQMQALQNKAMKLQGKAEAMSNPTPPVINSLKQAQMPLVKMKK